MQSNVSITSTPHTIGKSIRPAATKMIAPTMRGIASGRVRRVNMISGLNYGAGDNQRLCSPPWRDWWVFRSFFAKDRREYGRHRVHAPPHWPCAFAVRVLLSADALVSSNRSRSRLDPGGRLFLGLGAPRSNSPA